MLRTKGTRYKEGRVPIPLSRQSLEREGPGCGAFHRLTVEMVGDNLDGNNSGSEAGSWPISACVPSCRGVSSSVSCQGPCHASCAPMCVVPSQRSRCCCSLDAQAARKARRGRPWTSLVGRPLCMELEEPGSTVALNCFLACGWVGAGSWGPGEPGAQWAPSSCTGCCTRLCSSTNLLRTSHLVYFQLLFSPPLVIISSSCSLRLCPSPGWGR